VEEIQRLHQPNQKCIRV